MEQQQPTPYRAARGTWDRAFLRVRGARLARVCRAIGCPARIQTSNNTRRHLQQHHAEGQGFEHDPELQAHVVRSLAEWRANHRVQAVVEDVVDEGQQAAAAVVGAVRRVSELFARNPDQEQEAAAAQNVDNEERERQRHTLLYVIVSYLVLVMIAFLSWYYNML